MLRRFWLVSIVTLLLLPAAVQAQFKQSDWELTLNGTGANGPDFDGTSFSVGGSLGYFFTDQLEFSIRQTIGFTDIGVSGNLNGSTRVALDYHFDLGRVGSFPAVVPFIGGEFGYVYGDAVNDSFEAGPEAGLKFFVNNTTFVFLAAEYQFFFNQGDDASDSFSNGQFIYSLGIGFRF